MEQLKENIRAQLFNKRFRSLAKLKSGGLQNYYIREENPILYIVGIFHGETFPMEQEFLWSYGESIFEDVGNKFITEVILVSVLLGEKPEDSVKYTSSNPHVHYVQWYFDPINKTIKTEAEQPNKLIGLEKILKTASESTDKNEVQGINLILPRNPKGFPVVCASILICWVIILIYNSFSSDIVNIYELFGISRTAVDNGEYYKFITAMFVHDGWTHMLSNSIYLYYFGTRLELLFGEIKFGVIYFFSGLTGSLLSILFTNSVSVGASGGTYGLLGAMIMVVKKYGNTYIDINYSTLTLLGFISITSGFFRFNVNNLAHLGGLFCGMYFGNYFIKTANKISLYPQNRGDN